VGRLRSPSYVFEVEVLKAGGLLVDAASALGPG